MEWNLIQVCIIMAKFFLGSWMSCTCVYALHPSQQVFSHVGTISVLPGLNQYLVEDKVFPSMQCLQ